MTKHDGFSARVAVGALRWALLAPLVVLFQTNWVFSQDAASLTRPGSTAEIGPGDIGSGSFKAGEYNGLQNKGAFFLGNFDLRGGGAFNSDSAFRFRLKGNDLGLDTRGVSAEAGVQGKFRVTFDYDGIRRNRSDSYQTPYVGAGGTALTLPAGWIVPTVAGSSASSSAVNTTSARGLSGTIGKSPYIDVNTKSPTAGGLVNPTPAQISRIDGAIAADVPAFGNFDIYTTRNRYRAAASFSLGDHWGVDASFQPERKEGTKLMSTVSANAGGDIAAVVPDPIDTLTNQLNLAVNFNGRRSFVQAGYYGSFFRNNIQSLSWQTWASPTAAGNTMSSAPDNNFGQFSATGGLTFSPTTKLVVNGSYGRATQNDTFLTDPTAPVVPVSSLNGLVVNSDIGVRFTSRPAQRLNLVAAYKFDERDNQTAIHIFQYSDAGTALAANTNFPAGPGNPFGAILADNANANRPYSKRVNQAIADVDYGITSGQHVKGGYEFERTNRWCTGSWINCADAALTNEHTLRAEWRTAVAATVSVRADYAYSRRRTPFYDENAFLAVVPYAGVVPAGQSMSALDVLKATGLTAYGPVSGYNNGVFVNNTFFPSNNALANTLYGNRNRISELLGMRRYYVADRNRNKLRTVLTWDASEAFTVQAAVDYTKDDFPVSIYGLQRSKAASADFSGSYAFGPAFSVDMYYTYERLNGLSAGNSYSANSNATAVNGFTALSGNGCDGYTTMQQRNNNNKIDPCLNWTSNAGDNVHTVGVGLRARFGRLDTTADASVSRARSTNDVTGGNWTNNLLALPTAPSGTVAAFFIPAAALPEVSTNASEVRLNATYPLSARHALRVFYSYLRMNSADWAYDGMILGAGTPSGVLPTNEQPFAYSVNILGFSYVLRF